MKVTYFLGYTVVASSKSLKEVVATHHLKLSWEYNDLTEPVSQAYVRQTRSIILNKLSHVWFIPLRKTLVYKDIKSLDISRAEKPPTKKPGGSLI